ncbi:MAG: hypothetical protein U5L72_16280 [Bacteroidales bacterium]|nr:hypothetical protein [Bacteroidales bacterium]
MLAETNDFTLHLTSEESMTGLPAKVCARQLRPWHARREWTGGSSPSMRRATCHSCNTPRNVISRRSIFRAYAVRSFRGNEHDNRALVTRIADLRMQLSQLLGYGNYASYALEERMAFDTLRGEQLPRDLLESIQHQPPDVTLTILKSMPITTVTREGWSAGTGLTGQRS